MFSIVLEGKIPLVANLLQLQRNPSHCTVSHVETTWWLQHSNTEDLGLDGSAVSHPFLAINAEPPSTSVCCLHLQKKLTQTDCYTYHPINH